MTEYEKTFNNLMPFLYTSDQENKSNLNLLTGFINFSNPLVLVNPHSLDENYMHRFPDIDVESEISVNI
jgi:hypothetical protein